MSHTIPAQTVRLGEVLDLVTEHRGTRTLWDHELRGWHMLTDANAMGRSAGKARLYLVRGKMRNRNPAADAAAVDTYARWHRREPTHVGVIDDLPDRIAHRIGIAQRIGYRSDKWGKHGATHDYEHDFCEGRHVPPNVYADAPNLADASAIVIVGGDMRVTPEGID